MTTCILFDLDGTLFDRDAAVRELVREQYASFKAILAQIPEVAYVSRILTLDAHGHGHKPTVYQQALAEFALPADLAGTLVADFWERYTASYHPFADAIPALEGLRSRGFKLAIITNGMTGIQEAVIRRHGFARFMDAILISEREGIRKPEREIFNRGVRALGLDVREAAYVGDNPDVDVRGASEAGLAAIWRRNGCFPEPTVPHHAIDTLDELLQLPFRASAPSPSG